MAELGGTQAGEEAGNTHSVARGGGEEAQHTEIVRWEGAVVVEATDTFTVGGLEGTPKNITALVEHGNGIEGQSEVVGNTQTLSDLEGTQAELSFCPPEDKLVLKGIYFQKLTQLL